MNNEEFNLSIGKANDLLKKGDLENSKKIILDTLEKNKIETENENGSLLYFADVIQFLIYTQIVAKGKKVVWLSVYANLAYNMLGYIAVDEGKYEDAIKYLEKAIELNPMDVPSMIEKAECLMKLKRDTDFLDYMQKAYELIISPEDLAKYYRKIGFYYAEIEEYRISYAIYQVSMVFEYSDIAISEMIYNRQQMGDINFQLSMVDALNILKENHIPIGPREEIIDVFFAIYKDVEFENKMPNVYSEVKRRLYIFTGDERFKNNI